TVTYASRTNGLNITLDNSANDGESGELDDVLDSNEVIIGGGGNDSIDASTAPASVTLNGGAGNDQLTGGASADSLTAGAGDDTIVASSGADVFDGGAGNDTADFSAQGANLNITLDGAANDGAAGQNANV